MAAIVHDASLAEEQELIRAVGAAAALTLENERLDAELRARVEELRDLARQAGRGGRRGAPPARARPPRRRPAAARLAGARAAAGALRVGTESDEAGELLDEAIAELADATEELRELARGIHPAVLSDRGLEAGARGARPPRASAGGAERDAGRALPAPVEAAAYFVVAEALTNVAQLRAGDAAPTCGVARANGRLVVEVSDDGVGGADPGARLGAARPGRPGVARSTAASRWRARRWRTPWSGRTSRARGRGGRLRAAPRGHRAAARRRPASRSWPRPATPRSCCARSAPTSPTWPWWTSACRPPTPTTACAPRSRSGSELPGTSVLVLSQYVEEGYALELVAESAEGVGYLLKDRVADVDRFLDAVRRVARGRLGARPRGGRPARRPAPRATTRSTS